MSDLFVEPGFVEPDFVAGDSLAETSGMRGRVLLYPVIGAPYGPGVSITPSIGTQQTTIRLEPLR